MRRFRMLLLTLAALAALDAGVALLLERAPAPLVRYFEYGRSVPGKIARWRDRPGIEGDLLKVAWRGDIVADSARRFAAEPPGPVIRHYGQSFSVNIMAAAVAAAPGLTVDTHAAPSAPPNAVHALFQDDRANRRAGDVVVIGVLASAVHGLAAHSNMTWGFEQPAPAAYPVYAPGPSGLLRRDAVARRWEDALSPAFLAQLRAEDPHFTVAAFGWGWADRSPFLRLVRRALATRAIAAREAEIYADRRTAEALRAILADFAATARADGPTPVVLLIQNEPRAVFDLSAEAAPLLRGLGVAYLDTADMIYPADRFQFLPDRHFLPANDALFGRALLSLLPRG